MDNPNKVRCYLNTSLQCVKACGPLDSYYRTQSDDESIKSIMELLEVSKTQKVEDMPAETKKWFDLSESNGRNVMKQSQHHNDIVNTFYRGRHESKQQQDAAEYLLMQLGAELPECLQGNLVFERECEKCKHEDSNSELFVMLDFDSADKDMPLHERMGSYFDKQVVQGEEGKCDHACTKCGERNCTSQQIFIDEIPEVLIVYLRVYDQDMLKTPFHTPIPEYLDLGKYTTFGKSAKYKLASAGIHNGKTVKTGHYWAVVPDAAVSSGAVEIEDEVVRATYLATALQVFNHS